MLLSTCADITLLTPFSIPVVFSCFVPPLRNPPADHWALISGLPTYVAETGLVSGYFLCCYSPLPLYHTGSEKTNVTQCAEINIQIQFVSHFCTQLSSIRDLS